MPGYNSRQHIGYVDGATLAVSLCLTYTLCIACVRVWIRKGAYGVDDLVVSIATVITLAHSGTSYLALADGLGRPWSDLVDSKKLLELHNASIAGVTTFLLALYISKIAVLCFLNRIQSHARNRTQRLTYYICAALFVSFGLVSMLIAAVDCTSASGYYWAIHDNMVSCPSQSVRWQVITALDVATEIVLLALPVHLVWELQMPKGRKAILLTAFYLRAPVIGLSLGRNYYILRLRLPPSDAGLDSALVVIWMEVELAYALASSTLSALKAFTESFNSGWGLGFTRGKGDSNYILSDQSGSSGGSRDVKRTATTDSDVGPEDKRTSTSRATRHEATGLGAVSLSPASPPALKLRPERGINNTASVTSEGTHSESLWRHGACGASAVSNGSTDDMVILRETELSVHHDRAPMMNR